MDFLSIVWSLPLRRPFCRICDSPRVNNDEFNSSCANFISNRSWLNDVVLNVVEWTRTAAAPNLISATWNGWHYEWHVVSSCLTNVALVAAALARLPFGSASNGGAGDERPVTLAPLQISSSGSTWLVFLFNEMSLWITIEPSFTEFFFFVWK